MLVLSVEGERYRDKKLWSTHKVLGVYPNKELALQHEICKEVGKNIVILTDSETGHRERVGI